MHFSLTAMKNNPLAVVIVSNGPGELSTWVKPVINELKKINETLPEKNIHNFSLRLVLVPCPNATGKELSLIHI